MAYTERAQLYEKIEAFRKRPLISYVTSLRLNALGLMGADVIPQFIKQLNTISEQHEEVDILIVSNGGDPIVPWRIINMVRERFPKVGVLLPYVAYSAATLLALGADEIIMHPFSNLGPVDPQLISQRRVPNAGGQGEVETIHFAPEDARYFLEFVREDVKLSDQEQLAKVFELLCRDVGSLQLGAAKRSSELSLALGEQLLRLHMDDHSQAKTIAAALNRSYSHNFTLGRKAAKEIGLPVTLSEGPLEGLMWDIWLDIEDEMESNKPFNPLDIVLNSPSGETLLNSVWQINMPANLPPPLMQQVYNQALQQIQVTRVEPVDYEIFHAMLESTRLRSDFKTRGKITAMRLPDMNITVNIAPTFQGWTDYKS